MKKASRAFLLTVAVVFGLMVAGEWYMRFVRYHFEMQLFHLPSRAERHMASQAVTSTTNHIPERRGGDLSALIGIRHAAAGYEETRRPGLQIRDAYGFSNAEGIVDKAPFAVVVGDSFMAKGLVDEIFASQLSDLTGRRIYNRALIGHGPFISVQNYLDDERFTAKPPAYLVWGFAEREINGEFFRRFRKTISGMAQVPDERLESDDEHPQRSLIVHWHSFTPAKLKEILPASSLLAQTARWAWNRGRYLLFGVVNPDLIVSNGDVIDGPMLFYRYNLEDITNRDEVRHLPDVVNAILKLQAICGERGTRLVIVLIPEKEQLYRDWLPAAYHSPARPMPPSLIGPLSDLLREAGVPVVNLLETFGRATAGGRRLYWRDDTHWNPAGVRLAAQEVSELIETEFKN